MGYHSQRDVMFLKITLLLPKLVPSAKRVLEQGFGFPGHDVKSYQCYETNIDFDTRYLCNERNDVQFWQLWLSKFWKKTSGMDCVQNCVLRISRSYGYYR